MFLRQIRNRFKGAFFAAIAAVLIFFCGAGAAFVIAPRQELEWRRINKLPQLDYAGYTATPADKEVALTGTLRDNKTFSPYDLVAYQIDKWDVTVESSSNTENNTPSPPKGKWIKVEARFPALAVSVSGGTIKTGPVNQVTLGGNLHEFMKPGSGVLEASYKANSLADGSIRTRGFKNGDLITVVGSKTGTGEVRPERLYAGDRVQLVEEIKAGARAMFIFGISMMICSPVIFLALTLGALFGRRRR